MQYKFPEPEWLPLMEACERLGITYLRALQYASEGLLQLHAFSSHPEYAGTYERLQHGTWFADLWSTSVPVIVTPFAATELIHDDPVLLDDWHTKDGEQWRGRHEVEAYTLAVYRADLILFKDESERFEEAYGLSDQPAEKMPAPEHVQEYKPKQQRQKEAILAWLVNQKYEPLRLPRWRNDAPGVKAAAFESLKTIPKLFPSRVTFDKAWDALRSENLIGEEK